MAFFENISANIVTFLEDHLADIVAAVLIIVVFFLLLILVTHLLRKYIFSALQVNKYFAKFTGRAAPLFDLEKSLLRIFFFIGSLSILSAAAQVTQIDFLVDAFEGLFGWIGSFGLIAFNALKPITLALICAYFARTGMLWFGQKLKLDDRLGNKLDAGEAVSFSLSQSLSEVIYGLVFLFFFPAILQGLGLEELSEPITRISSEFLEWGSKLAIAAFVLFMVWFVAKIVRQILEGLLDSLGIDLALKKVFGENFLGSVKLARIIPAFLYALILGVAVLQALRSLELQTVTAPIEKILDNSLQGLQYVIVGSLMIMAAVYFAKIFSKFVRDILKDLGFDSVYTKIGLTEIKTGSQTPSQIVGYLGGAFLVFLVTMAALNMMGLSDLSKVLENLIYRLFDVMIGVVVFGVGLFIAKNLSSWVAQTTHADYSKLLSLIVKTVVIVIAGAMSLQHIGIADEIVTIAFALAMGSVALGVAIAIGLGAKETAGELVKNFVSKFK